MSNRSVFIESTWTETGYGSGTDSALAGVCGPTHAFQTPPWSGSEHPKRRTAPLAQSPLSSEHDMLNACLQRISPHGRVRDREKVPVFFGLSGIAGTWMGGKKPLQRAEAALAEWSGGTVAAVHMNACVASTCALIEAAAAVRMGEVPRAVAIGARKVEREVYELFRAGGAMSGTGEIQPFGAKRDGLLLGDGAAAILLSSEQTAERQVQLQGWAISGDGYDAVRPHPNGAGLAAAVRQAMEMAQVPAEAVDTVNAHGTGTAYNDSAESTAYQEVFGSALEHMHIASTKSSIGHALEATGIVEAAILAACLHRGVLPVNRMAGVPDQALAVSGSIGAAGDQAPEIGLSANSAFGGANAVVVLSRTAL